MIEWRHSSLGFAASGHPPRPGVSSDSRAGFETGAVVFEGISNPAESAGRCLAGVLCGRMNHARLNRIPSAPIKGRRVVIYVDLLFRIGAQPCSSRWATRAFLGVRQALCFSSMDGWKRPGRSDAQRHDGADRKTPRVATATAEFDGNAGHAPAAR